MEVSSSILSDLTVYMKYAKFNPEVQRRETWKELVDRNKAMHLKKFPQLQEEIESAYKFVYEKKALPSMRSMQFAGKPIEISPNRVYNCAYLPIDDWRAFGETIAVLMVCGNVAKVPTSVFDAGYPIPALIANNFGEMMSIPLYESALMFSALLLFVIIFVFNFIDFQPIFCAREIKKKHHSLEIKSAPSIATINTA